MSALVLAGCRTAPLGSYLQALGLLRLVARTLDTGAAGHWQIHRFVLNSRFDSVAELLEEVTDRFEPEAIVSPWNAGSGFAGNGKNSSAENALQQVRDSADPRLSKLRTTVEAADVVVSLARARGWGGNGDELWEKAHKPDVLVLCRNMFPDEALPWLDAAVALGGSAEPTFSRLLGTGGNFGRQDLSATYVQRALTVLGDRRSAPWLRAAITGDESVPYLRDAVGQFDPGRAGGIQSSPWEKADDKGFVNPWSFLLTVEGTLLLSGAVVRRTGAHFSRPSLPFQVRGSTAGFASSAAAEGSLGEIWLPEWREPIRLDQVQHLFSEGRAEWRAGPAQNGLDFARAVATLGVDRGIDAFTRHIFVDRLGQNPLAVPAGRIEVKKRGQLGLLTELDPWLQRLHGDRIPTGVAAGVRRVEQRLFDLAAGSGHLADVFEALGQLTEAVGRSGATQESAYPLELRQGFELHSELRKGLVDDIELRIALALATSRDSTHASVALRALLQPVTWSDEPNKPKKWEWSKRSVAAPLSTGLAAALTEVARRRAFPRAVPERVTDLKLGVKGPRIVFEHGSVLGIVDRIAFIGGYYDEQRLIRLLAGLLCVSWPCFDRAPMPTGTSDASNPALDLLLPFATAGEGPPFVRPDTSWPALLAAQRAQDVLDDARHRLVMAGHRFVIRPATPGFDHRLLAASLLLPTTPGHRKNALSRVAVPNEEKTT